MSNDPRNPLFSYLGPSTKRRVGSDGLVTIMCRICERPITKEQYRGFSTAICAVCQGEVERGKTPEEILAIVRKQEEIQKNDLYNEIGPSNFRAVGFGERIKEVVQKIRVAATRRRRSPLFAKKDKI
jgi:hypothetical protein